MSSPPPSFICLCLITSCALIMPLSGISTHAAFHSWLTFVTLTYFDLLDWSYLVTILLLASCHFSLDLPLIDASMLLCCCLFTFVCLRCFLLLWTPHPRNLSIWHNAFLPLAAQSSTMSSKLCTFSSECHETCHHRGTSCCHGPLDFFHHVTWCHQRRVAC